MTVLLIDDSSAIRAIARLGLAHAGGMDVIESGSGPDGIEAARLQHPDVILLDVVMPGMDGRKTLAALRANSATAAIPVVFLTAEDDTVEHRRLRALGALDVLVKPFDPRTIAAQLQAAMKES